MKKSIKKAVICILGIVLAYAAVVFFVTWQDPFVPWSPNYLYKDVTAYPLKDVDIGDSSDYMVVMFRHSGPAEKMVCDDTELIKANVDVFRIDNDGELYATTSDGVLFVFKDGEEIFRDIFDDGGLTHIEYGTLQFNPKPE